MVRINGNWYTQINVGTKQGILRGMQGDGTFVGHLTMDPIKDFINVAKFLNLQSGATYTIDGTCTAIQVTGVGNPVLSTYTANVSSGCVPFPDVATANQAISILGTSAVIQALSIINF